MSSKTSITKEEFPPGTTENEVKNEARMRVKAGATSSEYTGSTDSGWALETVWPEL
jgi:hypothetical protein